MTGFGGEARPDAAAFQQIPGPAQVPRSVGIGRALTGFAYPVVAGGPLRLLN